MSDLKELITSYTSDNMLNIPENEKELIELLALKKIFSQPYYKNDYYASAIAIDINNKSYFSTNEYHLPPRFTGKRHYSLHDDEPEYYGVDDIKTHLVDPSVFSRLEVFIDIAKNSSDNVEQYIEKLTNAYKGDNEFLNVIHSFSHLIPNYELFFNEDIKKIFKLDVSEISSSLCKNEISFSFFDNPSSDPSFIDNVNKKWRSEANLREKSLLLALESFENIATYYSEYNNEVEKLIKYIKENKPFIFKEANLADVKFSFYEVKGNKDDIFNKKFLLEEDFCINKDIMKNHNISISNVYSFKPEPESYKTIKSFVLEYLTKKDNDISENIPCKFFGLDFLDEQSLCASTNNKMVILAEANDDIVGYISFKSTGNDNTSFLKKVEYVCVKNNFRGTGLTEELYTKMCGVLNDNGNILGNSMYTKQGKYKLPRLKNRVRNKFPQFIMIDADIGDLSYLSKDEKEIALLKKDINSEIISRLEYLQTNEADSIRNNINQLKELYNNTMHYIDNNQSKFLSDGKTFNHINNKMELEKNIVESLSNLISSKKNKMKP